MGLWAWLQVCTCISAWASERKVCVCACIVRVHRCAGVAKKGVCVHALRARIGARVPKEYACAVIVHRRCAHTLVYMCQKRSSRGQGKGLGGIKYVCMCLVIQVPVVVHPLKCAVQLLHMHACQGGSLCTCYSNCGVLGDALGRLAALQLLDLQLCACTRFHTWRAWRVPKHVIKRAGHVHVHVMDDCWVGVWGGGVDALERKSFMPGSFGMPLMCLGWPNDSWLGFCFLAGLMFLGWAYVSRLGLGSLLTYASTAAPLHRHARFPQVLGLVAAQQQQQLEEEEAGVVGAGGAGAIAAEAAEMAARVVELERRCAQLQVRAST